MKTKLLLASWAVIFVHLLHAADPLGQWGQRTAPGTGYGLNAIAFGNGVFVAVGGNSVALVSADGVNWTNNSPGSYGELRNVHFLNGEFNVVGQSSSLLRSTNGVNWTAWTLPGANFLDVAYGNGRYVVVGDTCYASTNSVNWDFASPRIVTDFGTRVRYVKLECLAFGVGKFVARPRIPLYLEEMGVFHSTDGTNWVLISGGPYPPTPVTRPPSDMTYANGLFLVASTWRTHMYYSSDGASWNAANLGDNLPPTCVAYGANYFVGVGSRYGASGGSGNNNAATAFYWSTNATSWQQKYAPPTDPNLATRGVAFGNDTFVVVGISNSNPIIYQSGSLGGAPSILIEPVDRAAVVNNPVTFSVAAGGADPLAYQWQKDGSPISNATNSSFTISNVVATDGGGYRVIVTNSFGSVTSRVAQLSVSFLQIHEYAGITILGVVGKTYRIEASPQAGGGWTVLTNVVLPKSPFIWIDYESPNVAARIYRAGELP